MDYKAIMTFSNCQTDHFSNYTSTLWRSVKAGCIVVALERAKNKMDKWNKEVLFKDIEVRNPEQKCKLSFKVSWFQSDLFDHRIKEVRFEVVMNEKMSEKIRKNLNKGCKVGKGKERRWQE